MFEKSPPGAGGGYVEGNPNVSMADFIGKFSRAIMPKRAMEKKKMLVKEAMPILLEMEVRAYARVWLCCVVLCIRGGSLDSLAWFAYTTHPHHPSVRLQTQSTTCIHYYRWRSWWTCRT